MFNRRNICNISRIEQFVPTPRLGLRCNFETASKNNLGLSQMNSQTRDTILGIAGIVVSVCAGIFTFYNYNMETRKADINAIFEISKSLEGITLANNEPNRDIEDVSKRIFDLYVVVQQKYNQIRKPLFTDPDLWRDKWIAFHKSLRTAYTDGYEHAEEAVHKNWKEILRIKKVQILESANET